MHAAAGQAKGSPLRIWTVLLVAFAMIATACSTGRRPARDDDAPLRTTIDVQNQDFNDMTVYVVQSAARTRLGIAPGNKTTTLTIPSYIVGVTTNLRFECVPLAGNRAPVSEEIDVSPGDQLVMIVNASG